MPPWLDSGRLRGAELDLRGAQALHRAAGRPLLLHLLAGFSRAADGPLWVALVLLLPWLSDSGRREAGLMLLTGAINLVIYYTLKRSTRRQRCADVRRCSRPFSVS